MIFCVMEVASRQKQLDNVPSKAKLFDQFGFFHKFPAKKQNFRPKVLPEIIFFN